MSDPIKYPGDELALFQHAHNWKRYFSKVISPYIKGEVLENGAGIGSTTLLLNDGNRTRWVLAEPDAGMFALLQQKILKKELPGNCSVHLGTIDTVPGLFHTIIYIDVLEHIRADSEEMKKAAAKLHPGGHLIILSPAFGLLYSPFDKAIGHYRRYTKKMFRQLSAPGLEMILSRYYDSTGFFAGLLNKILLRQQYPTTRQVNFWDRWMVPVSKFTDKLFFHRFGKTIIGVWRKEQD